MSLLDRVNRLENRAARLEETAQIFAVSVENMVRHMEAELTRLKTRVDMLERARGFETVPVPASDTIQGSRGDQVFADIGGFLNVGR